MVNNVDKKKKIYLGCKLFFLFLIIIGLPIYIWLNYGDQLATLRSLEDVESLLSGNIRESVPIFMLIQVAQVVISVIPGNVIQFAAGYVYGIGLGLILVLIGAALGSALAFWLARLLGKEALSDIFGERFDRLAERISSKKGIVFMAVFFLLPLMPKDPFCYAAGVSNIRFGPFMVLSLICRIPSILACLLTGKLLMNDMYMWTAIVATALGILALVMYWKREKLIAAANKVYSKHFEK